MPQKERKWPLWTHRQCLVPTWRGWVLLACVFLAFCVFLLLEIHPFLSPNAPLPAGALVVEGWLPDYALKQSAERFRAGHFEILYVTGGPLEAGAPLSEYQSYAELGAAVLRKFGLGSNSVQPIPAPRVRQDRTYASARALKRWAEVNQKPLTAVTVVTEGPHARRSRLLFEKAFGPEVRVGIVALVPEGYEPAHWWRSSQGVRVVIGEALAYAYARLLFSPPRHDDRALE